MSDIKAIKKDDKQLSKEELKKYLGCEFDKSGNRSPLESRLKR
jgi:hypothetical protein